MVKRLLVILLVTSVGGGVAWFAGGGSVAFGGVSVLVWCALWSFGLNWLMSIPAIIWKTETFYDLVGSVTYISTFVMALWMVSVRALLGAVGWLVAVFVWMWALRLGSFLAIRIHRSGRDDRFVDIKRSASRFLIAWTLQGLWVFLTSLAALIVITSTQANREIGWSVWFGSVMWVVGFLIEIVADAQKSAFNAKPENRGKWVDVGLWRFSQHPNYFGEIVLWLGVFVMGFEVYVGWQWLACLSPLFVILLLTKVSGIPLLDKRAKEKFGDDSAYLAYKQRTNVLIPGPLRR